MEQVFNECLAEHKAAGTTVLLSSHILSEVERLADRVTIIRAGRAVESGTLDELRHLRRNRVARRGLRAGARTLGGLAGVHDVEVDGPGRLRVGRPGRPAARCSTCSARPGVVSLTSTPPTLEELFLDAYRSTP